MNSDKVRPGPIPPGVWRLNPERSQLLAPKTMTLWIIENGEQGLLWVAVETSPQGQTHVLTWRGRYGGPAAPVVGAGVEARLTCALNEGIRTEGEFAGLGTFVEFCTLESDGRRMVCRGEVQTNDGVRTYLEDFDWQGASPHAGT
ncbi:MAG TPA: hypothetical protein VGI93_19880 [Steroidobacteraceae bacterium]|jgi:hypothetical protein